MFFFKQKTAYEMRISDWSSDVCSSDLVDRYAGALGQPTRTAMLRASAGNWKNLFNPQTGYIEPRLASGLFTTFSNPLTGDGFVEGSSAQYTWFVPQDTGGLVEKMGSREAADRKSTRLNSSH